MKKNDYFKLTTTQQRTILEQTAIKHGLPKQAIEKDLWVTAMLQVIFSLPCANSLVFKGGTSLSKVWKLISRFSEDIDIAIDRSFLGYGDDLSKNRVSKLRRTSSNFVRDQLFKQLSDALEKTPLYNKCIIEVEPDGEGNSTHPEPRSIYVKYDSVFIDKLAYLSPEVKIEAGARSLLEPSINTKINSLVEKAFPTINTTLTDVFIKTAVAEKTFLEKAFLLHELFSVNNIVEAHRRSRHIYDLHMMMKQGIAETAIANDELWWTIHSLRSTLTSMQGVDYSVDVRKNIQLIPPKESLANWKKDYVNMATAMIYGEKPVFAELIYSMNWLELLFKKA